MLERVSTSLQSFYQMRTNRIHKFKPKVEIFAEIGPLVLKTVSTTDELREALALRYQVFHREMIGKTREHGIDVDEYDFNCDHLIIMDKKNSKVVGTYRLNCSLFGNDFYSAREFNISKLMAHPGVKLELGRACIHKDYRKGLVISLLWRGIADYMIATQANLLFGCASIKTQDPRQAALLYRHFIGEGRVAENFLAPPTMSYAMPGFDHWIATQKLELTEEEVQEAAALIPPLCRAYMKAGAFVGGAPAWDWEFKCIDFLTILRRDDLNKTLWKRFKLDSAES